MRGDAGSERNAGSFVLTVNETRIQYLSPTPREIRVLERNHEGR